MPVQPIGGARVYVITGSGRDPRLTSTGQSWANLVTQQKYRLWQEAQKQALREIQYDQMTFQQQLKVQEQLRSEINSNIEDTRRSIQDLKLAEKKSAQTIQEKQVSERNLRGRSVSISGGRTLKDEVSVAEELDKELRQEERNLRSAKGLNSKLRREAEEALGEVEKREILKDMEDLDPIQSRISEIQSKKQTLEAGGEIPELKRVRQTATGGSRRTAERPIVTADPISYAEEIAALEAEQATLQEQLAGLEMPTLDRPDLIGRTREVYGREFAPQPRQAPTVSPQRALELQTLGIERAPSVGLSPSQFVAREYTRKVKEGNFNNKTKALAAMQLIKHLDQHFDPTTTDYEKARQELIKAYQKQINPQAFATIEAGKKGDQINEESKSSKLVLSLYNPSSGDDQAKRQELFDNASIELKKYHGENEEGLSESLTTLVQLHEQQ